MATRLKLAGVVGVFFGSKGLGGTHCLSSNDQKPFVKCDDIRETRSKGKVLQVAIPKAEVPVLSKACLQLLRKLQMKNLSLSSAGSMSDAAVLLQYRT